MTSNVVPYDQKQSQKNLDVSPENIWVSAVLSGILLTQELQRSQHKSILGLAEELSHTPNKWNQLVQEIVDNSPWLFLEDMFLFPLHKDIRTHWLDRLKLELSQNKGREV